MLSKLPLNTNFHLQSVTTIFNRRKKKAERKQRLSSSLFLVVIIIIYVFRLVTDYLINLVVPLGCGQNPPWRFSDNPSGANLCFHFPSGFPSHVFFKTAIPQKWN